VAPLEVRVCVRGECLDQGIGFLVNVVGFLAYVVGFLAYFFPESLNYHAIKFSFVRKKYSHWQWRHEVYKRIKIRQSNNHIIYR
jgi:hypothetical protein